jgi:hypothetical protein
MSSGCVSAEFHFLPLKVLRAKKARLRVSIVAWGSSISTDVQRILSLDNCLRGLLAWLR